MKKLLYALLLFSLTSVAQTLPGDFLNADSRIPDIPQSPEVAAFEKYGSLPVNLYTGSPSIAIPVYTLQGHEMNFPISLTYDASGIKVDQIATNVGLGWNLNFGGVVSRNVQGQADFNIVSGGFYTIVSNVTRQALDSVYSGGYDRIFGTSDGGSRRAIYENYQLGLIDFQADTFSFNVNGLSGTMIIDYEQPIGASSYAVYCVENPDIKAEFIGLDSWKITNTDGTSYFFDRAERTRHSFTGTGPNALEYEEEYSSAWYLTKIVSPNGLDEFDLTYGPSVYWQTENHRDRHHKSVMTYYNPNACASNGTITQPEIPIVNDYKKQQFNLTSISHNGVTVLTTELNNETTNERADLSGMRYYEKLIIKDEFTDPLLEVDLNLSYFQKNSSQTNKEDNSRLRLDSISFYRNPASNDKKTYVFDYYEPNNFPSRDNNGVDFWGYYTGSGTDGAPLVPSTTEFPFPAPGIDRSPDFFHTKKGTLKSITYPTEGKTTFTYEAHKVPTGPGAPNGVVGGLRIAKQETETLDINGISANEIKYYYYGDIVADVNGDPNLITVGLASGDTEIGEAIVQQDLIFTQIKTVWDVTDPCGNIHPKKYYQHANNRSAQVPNAVTYTHVSEVVFKGTEFIGCTVNKFYNESYDAEGLITRPFYNEKLLNGELNESMVYDSNLNLKRAAVNTYENLLLGVPENFPEFNGIFLYAPDGTDPSGDPYVYEPACKDAAGSDFKYYPATILQCLANNNQAAPSAINYKINKYTYNQYHKRLLQSVNKSYEGSSFLEQNTNYVYQDTANLKHYFPVEIKTTDSKGKENKTEIIYVADLPGTAIMDTLIFRNQIAEPVEVKQYYNANLLSRQKKNFTVAGTSINGFNKQIIRPDSIEVAKAGDAYETRRIYHSYDSHGNLTEVSQPNGSYTYYIWGYNGKLLLAEIKNKPPGNIPPGIQNVISAAQTTSNTENSSGEEDTLRTQLETIRNQSYFGESQVTTFTYDPGIGVTSVADPRSYVMYYQYDEHNRLKSVTDADGNLIGANEYSFRINN